MQIKKFMVGPMAANCYVVWDTMTKEAAIIDPGAPDRAMEAYIADTGLQVTKILLTHGHFDHIGGLDEARNLTSAPVYIHEADADCLVSAGKNISTMVGQPMNFEPAEVEMKHGDIIEIGKTIRLKVLHTPGHTPGGVCFAGDGVIFSGDTLFRGSVGRTDFPGGDYNAILDSLDALMVYDDETQVKPGHGEDTTIGYERQANPFLRRS